jgi:hypothetical protein
MKRVAFLCSAACLLVISTNGQGTAKIGVQGGLNVSSLKIEDYEDTDSRIGFFLGLLAHIHLGASETWALQPEVVYSQEGGKVNLTGGDVEVKLDYITFPVAIQYMFNNGFRFEAVPQLGVLVNSKYEDDDGAEDDADEDFKSVNFSIGPGISYLSYSGFGVGARYMFGVSNIGEGTADIRANTFSIRLFYLFDHHHKARSR